MYSNTDLGNIVLCKTYTSCITNFSFTIEFSHDFTFCVISNIAISEWGFNWVPSTYAFIQKAEKYFSIITKYSCYQFYLQITLALLLTTKSIVRPC